MANTCSKVEVALKGDIGAVLKQATADAAKHDIVISGDTSHGTVKHKSVKVWGTYSYDEKTKKITIQMNEDTWVTSCSKIEQGIRTFFQGK